MKRFLLFSLSIALVVCQTIAVGDDKSGIAAEVERHNKVIKELNDELKQARDKLAMELKTCTTQKEKDAQQADYARTKKMIATQMLEEDLAFMLRLAKLGQSEAESVIDDIQKIEGLGGEDDKGKNPTSKGSATSGTLVPQNGLLTYTGPSGVKYTFPVQINKGGVAYQIVPSSVRSWTRPYVEYQNGNSFYVMLGTPTSQ